MTEDRTKPMGSYERLFQTLPRTIPSPRLCERVVDGIRRERTRMARTRFFVSLASGIASLAASAYALETLIAAATKSGFAAYASLAFSDGAALASNTTSFGALLLESLPGPETTLMLALLAILIQSVRVAVGSGAEWARGRALAAA